MLQFPILFINHKNLVGLALRASFLLLLAFSSSCSSNQPKSEKNSSVLLGEAQRNNTTHFDSLINKAECEGSILVYSAKRHCFYSNNYDWAMRGRIPASTYKIPHSIIALETGVVDESTLFFWDGKERALDIWEQDLSFNEAFRKSCVPCYQEIARKVGPQRMRSMLNKINYGTMEFDSSNIDLFWLQGESKISPKEQIDFLQRLQQEELPISNQTRTTVLDMMTIDTIGGALMRGKTGWAIREDQNNGWFVGLLESATDTLYVAVNINPQPSAEANVLHRARYDLAVEALKFINKHHQTE